MSLDAIPERPDNGEVVARCRAFGCLTTETLNRLASKSFMAYAEKGQMIWAEGSPAEFCSVVGVGFVITSQKMPNRQSLTVELLGPGQTFGLIAVLQGKSLPLTATAATNCWYLKIPAREARSAFTDSRMSEIVEDLQSRLRRSRTLAACLSSLEPEERLEAVLRVLADSYGRATSEGIELEVPVSRRDVADIAGSPEQAIRLLERWELEGLLAVDKSRFVLRRPEGMGIVRSAD
ncbi:MAG TPA: Crp/Fnr family transcriptional regulator [Fimbriimonadaceae bacterium]|nr:Crp/Fnr family transcriptional regulator [Fimbriimonadaceae bacterium]